MTDEATIKRLQASVDQQGHGHSLLSSGAADAETELLMQKAFGDTVAASLWWITPNPACLGKTPREWFHTGHKQEVKQELQRLMAARGRS